MDQIIQINIAGSTIPVHENAYEALRDFINSIRTRFGSDPNGIALIQDIEKRIVNHLSQRLSIHHTYIDIDDIKSVESEMGDLNELRKNFYQQSNQNPSFTPKTLYKINNKKAIGGVCAGIAEYFNIDVLLVRLGFIFLTLAYGIAPLIYIALWIFLPAKQISNLRNPKRLYRIKDKKVVGGVCVGIAKFANTDVVWIRLLFASPLLLIVFLNIININGNLINLVEGLIPTSFLLYIILWIAIPMAKTQEDYNKINPVFVSDLTPNNSFISPQVSKKDNQTLNTILKAFLLFMLGIGLLAFIGINVGIIAAMIGLNTETIIDGKSIFQYFVMDSDLELIFWASVMLLSLTPAIIIILLMRRIVIGPNKDRGNTWYKILPLLFVAGIAGIAYSTQSITQQFDHKSIESKESSFYLLPNDTLHIHSIGHVDSTFQNQWNQFDSELFKILSDKSLFLKNVNFEIVPSSDDSLRIVRESFCYGADEEQSQKNVDKIEYNWYLQSNKLALEKYLKIPEGEPFRFQSMNIIIHIPSNIKFTIDENLLKYQSSKFSFFNKRFKISSGFKNDWDGNKIYHFLNGEIQSN